MNVLSLFDGMSCGQLALQKSNIKYDKYFASEIKQNAIKLTQHHFPNTIQLGDVRNINLSALPKIDLLIGGSPCQDFSSANTKQLGLQGKKSILFYEYLRILKELKPKYFLLENVRMKKESEKQLNKYLGVIGMHINSTLVSYQRRARIYWTNLPTQNTLLKDRNINFQDYKDTNYEYCKLFKVNKTPSRIKMWNNGNGFNGIGNCHNITHAKKIYCLTRKQDRSPNSGLIAFDDFCRFLTRRELEQAQCVPAGYTNLVSYNQAQDLLGDGWTIDVVSHILKEGFKKGMEK
jgi:DNA (cytosine-5)-methyltransferase 3A|tara:strand:- start:6355 stop:7227 length:873 start_codon:yes stop_codon:yes gene_type:complete